MNVLLDAHMLGSQEGGNETYIDGLLNGFEVLIPDGNLSVTALCPPAHVPSATSQGVVRRAALTSQSNSKRIFVEIPRLAKDMHSDLVHVTYNASPFLTCPLVVTVHDVIFRIFPRYFSPRVRLLLFTLLPLTMYRAKAILTPSERSKKDIEHFYPFTCGKIHVVHAAAGAVAQTAPNFTATNPSWLAGEFILAVGTLQPRKNLERLIRAYVDGRRRGSIHAKLLLTGKRGWQHSQILTEAKQSGFEQDIVFTGYVRDEILAALYQRCVVFIYPSLYEGFGLPVLEAMAHGAPVITSQNTSMSEIAGNAAMLIDPYSIDNIRGALEALLGNPNLRQELRHKGKKQIVGFSWLKTAARIYELYKTIPQFC